MARNHVEHAQEIRRWKDLLEDPKKIPVLNNHNYKNPDDVYERMHAYLKDWVEHMFGYRFDKDGYFQMTAVEEDTPEAKEWMVKARNLTQFNALEWWDGALSGGRKAKESLPRIDAKGKTRDELQDVVKEMKSDVPDYFFPAYRALRDSFDNRSIFQWFMPSKHRQYVAERDALKAMTNLITSMTGYTKSELNAKYEGYKGFYPDYEIYPEKVAKPVIKVAEEKEEKVETAPFERLSVFRIGYRPNRAALAYEKKALGEAQKMMMKGLITDEAMKKVIKENVARWKTASDLSKTAKYVNPRFQDGQYDLADIELRKSCPDYDPEKTMKAVDDALAKYAEQKKSKGEPVQVDIKEPKVDSVPPIEQKPVAIDAPVSTK